MGDYKTRETVNEITVEDLINKLSEYNKSSKISICGTTLFHIYSNDNFVTLDHDYMSTEKESEEYD